MSNYEYDTEYLSPKEMRQLEKRASCKCTCLKCPRCGKYKDTLVTSENQKIDLLKYIIKTYESYLMSAGYTVIPVELLESTGVIDLLVDNRLKTYEIAKKNGRIRLEGL